MSSAILYLAIIAIWLCVLIPRWLKRDSARGAAVAADTVVPGDAPVSAADGGEEGLADDGMADEEQEGAPLHSAPKVAATAPLSAEEARRRIMAGRRRLLGMLIALEGAAIALAFLHLAALWVVVPPTIMLAGYFLLLREAAQADAERSQREAEAVAHARERAARARAHARARAAQRATPAAGAPVEETAAALAAKFAAAPVPADYEEPGRDFAPGLAGKYTTSNADQETAAEDHTYELPRLRAVGD
jgi:hypothetical protein